MFLEVFQQFLEYIRAILKFICSFRVNSADMPQNSIHWFLSKSRITLCANINPAYQVFSFLPEPQPQTNQFLPIGIFHGVRS